MNAQPLLDQLASQLSISLPLSPEGTCRVSFDNDDIDFEQTETGLYIIATLADASGREDAYERLLKANYLGSETGGACIGLDANQNVFTIHTILHGDMDYSAFEKELCAFIRALRYWKEWLSLPPVKMSSEVQQTLPFDNTMLKI